MSKKKTVVFKMAFGKDQETGIDNLLKEMKDEGLVLLIEKDTVMFVRDELKDMIAYTITFNKIFSLYVFGYRSANLLKYMFGNKNDTNE